MISLILFCLTYATPNIHIFDNPKENDILYINNPVNISWITYTIPDTMSTISDIFLTHGDPPIISKYDDNIFVFHDTFSHLHNITSYVWTPPNVLNNYDLKDIQWRFMISNTNSPYAGHITKPNVDNLILLSDYFSIVSNMNVSLNNEIGYSSLDTPINIDISGFDSSTNYTLDFYFKDVDYNGFIPNASNSIHIGRELISPITTNYPITNYYYTLISWYHHIII